MWDLSLVDPDNRRPVDYQARRGCWPSLAGAADGPEQALAAAGGGRAEALADHNGCSRHRRRHPAAFGPASGYQPLPVTGAKAGHAVAFRSALASRAGPRPPGGLAVLVPRLVVRPGRRLGRHHRARSRRATGTACSPGSRPAARRRWRTCWPRFPVAVLAPEPPAGPGEDELMAELRVWAPGRSSVDLVARRPPRPDAPPQRGGWWTAAAAEATGPAAPTTRSASTAARHGRTRARPASRTACTARPGSSTTRRSAGPTAAGAGWPLPGAVLYELHVGTFTRGGHVRRRRSSTWTTWSTSASTRSS